MLGWIKAAVGFGVKMYSKLNEGSKTDVMSDALPFAISTLLPTVKNAIAYGGKNTKEKFDAWLDTLDAMTGDDQLAIDLIPSLPPALEEKFFDHLKEAARIYGYMMLKVEGYAVE